MKKYVVVLIVFILVCIGIFGMVKLASRNRSASPDNAQNQSAPSIQPNLFSFSGVLKSIEQTVGSSSSQDGNQAQVPSPFKPLPAPPKGRARHVVIVLEENQGYQKVMGNTQEMPYLNSLASTYAYSKNYYANTHPSIGNYFMLTAGDTITNNSSHTDTVTDDNIVRHLVAAGKTWKEYSEGLPSIGFTGSSGESYDQDHTPLAFYSDVRDNPDQKKNLVPFSQFTKDLADNKLPDYSFIIPNSYNDADGCPPSGDCNLLATADNWLKTNIDPVFKSADFNSPGGGILIITFDEAAKSDKTHGGGQIPWIVAGADVKKGFVSNTFYQHENTLRFMAELLGLTSFPGKAASAASMKEFLTGY
ncbi:MAG: hypothetical protein NT170_03765 [Candidatus Moranbacteria bacterium]|nr:hypothetical protein [Candidatus Moranbacteria bacterium]